MLNSDNYNPDVLTCLANLSNDEVFTPPKLVNEILDRLPQELFKSSSTTFLDPVSKSGVFLREIAKRLIEGLELEIPDLQQRLNHIFTRQLFGIAITELTSLLSRRSVYCSKRANGKYSVCDVFGKSAIPIYQNFVHQSKKLNPRFLSMIIPARWYGGGKGLNDFREEMLSDKSIRKIVDFEDSSDIFPGVSIAGGICYFLWDRDNKGLCEIKNIQGNNESSSIRQLNEFSTLIRQSQAVPITRKVTSKEKLFMNQQVSSYRPFGLRTYIKPQKNGDILLRWQKGVGPYKRSDITVGVEMIDKWKVISSRSGHEHAGNPDKDGRRRVLSVVDIIPPGTVCTETYLVIGVYDSENEAKNLVEYMKTKFLRFLVSQFMYSHSITKDTYTFVSILDMKIKWSDELLYDRFDLSEDEIIFIESKIRDME